MTLYRQYRPQTFADLVGQNHVRATLQSALAQGRVAHAYLFTGPRGVGKTTVARLLAKAINCQAPVIDTQALTAEPCNACQLCQDITEGRSLDVIEIDAASNRGIDEIRELREKIKFAPSHAAAKVFIIDEVHMLTKEAFNALLKTLEEPPAHARFVLATTELHKVPVTIASRCQVFPFKKARQSDLVGRLQHVAEQEGLEMDEAATIFLADLASGSYRDALSLLDQVSSVRTGRLTVSELQELLGFAAEERVLGLLEAMAVGSSETALGILHEMDADGLDLDHVAGQIVHVLRSILHVALGVQVGQFGEDMARREALAKTWSADQLAELIQAFVQAKHMMKQAPLLILPLEVTVVAWTAKRATPAESSDKPPTSGSISSGRGASTASVTPSTPPSKEEADQPADEIEEERPAVEQASDLPVSPPKLRGAVPENFWSSVLASTKAKNMNLFGLLQQAELASLDDEAVHVRVPFSFARDRLLDRKYRTIFEEAAGEVAGRALRLECVVEPRQQVAHDPDAEPDSSVLAAIGDVFELEV